jgi:hypothetical protein
MTGIPETATLGIDRNSKQDVVAMGDEKRKPK